MPARPALLRNEALQFQVRRRSEHYRLLVLTESLEQFDMALNVLIRARV